MYEEKKFPFFPKSPAVVMLFTLENRSRETEIISERLSGLVHRGGRSNEVYCGRFASATTVAVVQTKRRSSVAALALHRD